MMTTYFWMLCEGVFLWVLLTRAPGEEEESLGRLFVLGWAGPLLVTIPYAVYRAKYEDDHCWMDPGYSVIFLSLPAILVIALNMFFLFNVIRILKSKLEFQTRVLGRGSIRSGSSSSSSSGRNTLRSARAIIILVPIFGLHFILLPVRPEKGSSLEYAYDILSSVSTSTQGLAVSILLCFTNHEVISKVKRTFDNIWLKSTLRSEAVQMKVKIYVQFYFSVCLYIIIKGTVFSSKRHTAEVRSSPSKQQQF